MEKVNLVVIGAGPAGYEAAIRARQLNQSVVLIEKDYVGGTCLNRGCVPTKSYLYQAHQFHLASQVGQVVADGAKMQEEKESCVSKLRDGIQQLIKANQIRFIVGQAQIVAEHQVLVNDETIETDFILIATGSQSAVPPISGIEHAITSDQVLDFANKLVQRVVIIGAGVIGLEFADLYLDLGCDVTIIEVASRPLTIADREIGQNLQMIFKRRKAKMSFDVQIHQIHPHKLTYTEKGEMKEIEADLIIAATGRVSVLCPSLVELQLEKGRLVVNEFQQTSCPSIFAAGDVSSPIQLAHLASAQAIRAVETMFHQPLSIQTQFIPSCLYTHPEAAWIGLSEDEAKAQGKEIMVGKASTLSNAKAVIEHAPRGFVKLVADSQTRKLLGGVIVGEHASDWISTVGLALVNELTIEQCHQLIFPHPSWSETLHEALLDFDKMAIHTVYRR